VLNARYGEDGRLKEGGRLGSSWWHTMAGYPLWFRHEVWSWFDDNIFGEVEDGSSTFSGRTSG